MKKVSVDNKVDQFKEICMWDREIHTEFSHLFWASDEFWEQDRSDLVKVRSFGDGTCSWTEDELKTISLNSGKIE